MLKTGLDVSPGPFKSVQEATGAYLYCGILGILNSEHSEYLVGAGLVWVWALASLNACREQWEHVGMVHSFES